MIPSAADFITAIDSLHSAGIKFLVRLKPCGKDPLVIGGHKVVSESDTVAKSWFLGKERHRLPNLGAHTGGNGLAVVDVDRCLLSPGDVLGALGVRTCCTATANGGVHVWFKAPGRIDSAALRSAAEKKLAGHCSRVDVKSGDSYVVVPPSVVSGSRGPDALLAYRWHVPPWDTAPAAVPDWLQASCPTDGSLTELGGPPSDGEVRAALDAARRLLNRRGRMLLDGGVVTDDRSDQGAELGHLLYEAGISDPRAVAAAVYGSEIHRRKFSGRKDRWLDCVRIALRTKPAGTAAAPAYETIDFESMRSEFRDPKFLIYPILPRNEITLLDGDDGIGKALALDTQISTPHGFKEMKDIRPGDVVFDGSGKETAVLQVSPVFYKHKCYEVVFDDGSRVVTDAEHLWRVQTAQQRTNVKKWRKNPKKEAWNRLPGYSIVTTEEMRRNIRTRNGRVLNYSVDIHPFAGRHTELPIPPYTLGAWLGDGTAAHAEITAADWEILQYIEADGISVYEQPHSARTGENAKRYWLGSNGKLNIRRERDRRGRFTGTNNDASLQSVLRRTGLLGNKHIPRAYLFCSFEQRLSLLQGLMDTDGTISKSGVCEYTTASKPLAEQVASLLSGLGVKCCLKEKEKAAKGFGKTTAAYRIHFTTTLPVFRLARKRARIPKAVSPSARRRFVKQINEVESVPVKCISVASPEHTYMCTDRFITTHNSWLWMALSAGLTGSKKCPVPYDHTAPKDASVLVLTAEDDPYVTVGPRLLSLGADLKKVKLIKPAGAEYVNGITAAELEPALPAVCAAKPDLVVVDHVTVFAISIDNMDTGKDVQVRKMLDALKSVAKKLECAVLVIRHFRKGSGSAKDRGLGSVAFRATARSHLVVGFDPEDPARQRRILTQVKMTLVPKLDEGIAYTLGPDGFEWLGTCSVNPDALTDPQVGAKVREETTKSELARELLLEYLADGEEVERDFLFSKAKKAGISERTLRNVKISMGILDKSRGYGKDKVSYWFMPPAKRRAHD